MSNMLVTLRFGGQLHARLDSLLAAPLNTTEPWRTVAVAGATPAARIHASLTAYNSSVHPVCACSNVSELVLFGGRAGPLRPCAGVAVFDSETSVWLQVYLFDCACFS